MPRNSNEKLLSGGLDSKLIEEFSRQVKEHGFVKKRALRGAVELWLSLPEGLQVHILSGKCGKDVLAGAMKYLFRNHLDAIREKFETLRLECLNNTQATTLQQV